MLVTAPPSVPANTTLWYSGTPQLLDDPRDVFGLHAKPVPVVDRDHGRPAAAAETFDRAERERPVFRSPSGCDAELTLECLEYLLRAGESTRDVRADLDVRPADRLEVVLVVEGGDRQAVRGREVERVGDLADRIR